jgi:hypothetical protein
VSSPSYTWNIANTTISVSGSKSGISTGGGLAVVPNLNQSICTYCLGHSRDFVVARGDESNWTNGDSVLEATFAQKYGGTTDGGTLDGSAIVEVVTWDLKTSSSPFSWWSSDSREGGGIEHSWPSIAHAVVNSSDHIILTDTLARHQSGNTHHPTNEILRISPSLSTLLTNESGIDEKDSTKNIGDRWGDYSTTIYDPLRNVVASWGDCTQNAGFTDPTVQWSIYNEVSP